MTPNIPRVTLAWLLIAQGFVLLPLFFFLPVWLPIIWFCMFCWRIQIYRGVWSHPSNIIKYVLSFLSVVALIFSFSNALAVEPAVAFLVVAFILKLSEMNRHRDAVLIINICFVSIAVGFLFAQSLMFAVYSVFSCIIVTAAWLSLYQNRKAGMRSTLWSGTKIILQSIPVMLLLFLFMPRMGQLWHVPSINSSSKTGFSESMSPGDFSRLSKSNELAFRVTFTDQKGQDTGVLPPPRERYWRGLIFDQFDGRSWQRGPRSELDIFERSQSTNTQKKNQLSSLSLGENDLWHYEVLLEPHSYSWLFVLPQTYFVHSTNLDVKLVANTLAKAKRPVRARSSYVARSIKSSSKHFNNQEYYLSEGQLRKYLKYPSFSNPQAQAYANTLKTEQLTPEKISSKVLSDFQKSFVYTLQPPQLGEHSVDDFFFQTQRGFCEHFASSFVFLMRAAGVPSRVVVGYQGGEETNEGYLRVRQSDAHAWAEIWTKGSGWQRIDPTAAVAPSRIEHGLQDSLSGSDAALVGGSLFGGQWSSSWAGKLINSMSLALDSVGYSWHRWVLSYDDDRQKGFLRRWLGGTDPWRIGLVFLIVSGGVLSSYLIILKVKSRKKYQYAGLKDFDRLEAKLSKQGFSKKSGETAQAFLRRVIDDKPEWAAPISDIAERFNALSYGSKQSHGAELREAGFQEAELKASIRRFLHGFLN